MKNKDGFTIVELVATFAILAVIMGIGILTFNYVFNRVSDDYYHTIENSLLLSGNEYYQDHRNELPVNGYNKVAVKTLIDNHYIEPIKDKNGNICTEGDVYLYPKQQGQYNYDVRLKCGDYESEGVYCN